MIHIVKNEAGKFDAVTLAPNGRHLAGTRQGFERKTGAINNVRAQLKAIGIMAAVLIQDDTLTPPRICRLTSSEIQILLGKKTNKPYNPNNF